MMGTRVIPVEESAGAGRAIVEAASQRVTRLGGVLARRRPPTASPSNRTPAIRTAMPPVSMKFRTAKLRRGSPDSVEGQGAARMIKDYYDFPTDSDF